MTNDDIRYVIRPIAEEDVKRVATLEQICFTCPMSEENVRNFLLSENGLAFVCYDNENKGELCAYCGAICVLDEAQVLNVATAPEHRRRGLGRELVFRLISAAKERGAESVTLEVRESNLPARTLYEALGFYGIGRIKKYYTKPTEDALILKLDINK